MRVLLIGGSGFISGAVVRRLRERGAEAATFHRGEGADVRGDRRELSRFREPLAALRPDVVVDAIAFSERDAAEAVATLRGAAGRIVVLSSQDVYAAYGRLLRLERGEPMPVPSTEDSRLRESRFPYRARASGPEDMAFDYEKILVEQVVASAPELPATILRLPCVYGPRDPHRRIGEVVDSMRSGEDLLIDRAKASWHWTRGYVDDVADAIALAAMDERATGRTYNLGEQIALSESEWIARIGVASSWRGKLRPVAVEELPPGTAEPYDFSQDLVADTSRIRRELGFLERISPDEALRTAVAAER